MQFLPDMATSTPTPAHEKDELDEHKIIGKLNRNILGLFFVMTMLCWLDRTSLAFAGGTCASYFAAHAQAGMEYLDAVT